MTASERLIESVLESLYRHPVSDSLKTGVEALIDAYRLQVACSLRLEETIHKMRKYP